MEKQYWRSDFEVGYFAHIKKRRKKLVDYSTGIYSFDVNDEYKANIKSVYLYKVPKPMYHRTIFDCVINSKTK